MKWKIQPQIQNLTERKGKVIDNTNGLDGEGPFSPERSGGLPVADYRNGCQDAFEYVYKYFEPKIRYMAKTKGNCVCTEDLFSEITLQLFQCVKKYKFGKIKFNTFFWRCAQNVVGMYYTRKNAQKRKNSQELQAKKFVLIFNI